jgi:hypothetical protein
MRGSVGAERVSAVVDRALVGAKRAGAVAGGSREDTSERGHRQLRFPDCHMT